MAERKITRVFEGMETMDGAGVRLHRFFSNREVRLLDPFLLLDLFGSDDPDEYLPGFPTHPHRGIETVTYMLAGTVRHGDSMGNSGYIGPGDVQWMTAGSGIVHEEMPQPSPLGLRGFQLWVNLSAADKMRDPAYNGYSAQDIPVEPIPGGEVHVIAGSFGSSRGPVRGLPGDPRLYDLRLGDSGSAEIEVPTAWTAFVCVYEGELENPIAPPKEGSVRTPYCALFGDGEKVRIKAAKGGASLIFAAGAPIDESIAWGGPIVMNTQAELDLAFEEYASGTFVKAHSR
jgi:hypothetical protein